MGGAADLPDHDDALPDPGGRSGEKPAEEAAGIFAFPRGAAAGVFFHELFEQIEFRGGEGPELEALVSRKLRQHGFGPEWQAVVSSLVRKVLGTALDTESGSFTLNTIGKTERLTELEFYFPLAPITPERLSEVLSRCGAPGFSTGSARSIEEFRFEPAAGFMRGFIDLVFRNGERYYIIDWKSNHLGNRIEDYGPEALAAAMGEHAYPLQYTLYTMALHQYLRRRVPGYDYDRHFGGIFYLFLRGVDPAAGPGFGVFRDRPRAETIEGLCRELIPRVVSRKS